MQECYVRRKFTSKGLDVVRLPFKSFPYSLHFLADADADAAAGAAAL